MTLFDSIVALMAFVGIFSLGLICIGVAALIATWLERPRRSLRCSLLGHRLDPVASYYYGLDHCMRCNRMLQQPERGLRELAWMWWGLFTDWAGQRWYYFRCWLRCDECGHRFGQHDESFDHLPF